MSENGLSIYRCPLSNGSEQWFLSKLEPGVHIADTRNIDYYSSTAFPKSTRALVPHPAEWTTMSKGRPSSPMVKKVLERDLVVLEGPDDEHLLTSSNNGDDNMSLPTVTMEPNPVDDFANNDEVTMSSTDAMLGSASPPLIGENDKSSPTLRHEYS